MYYTAESAHGSETSHGFCNDTVVKCFSSRSARDDYVKSTKNITVEAIPASMATKRATNYSLTMNKTNAPTPFSNEFWAIVPPYDDDETPGLVGILDTAREDDHIVRRFYK